MMAPTEVLARQHYENLQALYAPFGIETVLLTGSMTAAAKRKTYSRIENHEADVIIGTQALFQEKAVYDKLALIVTDEQHRFGVRQRTTLENKGDAPHVMVMSATPIPRTLSLVLYGDLDLSAVDEMPPGRTPVRTRIVPEEKREGLYAFIRAQAAQGRQTYVVCPLVGEAEMDDTDLRSAAQEQRELEKALAPLKVGLVHGKMNKAQKEDTLSAFYAGALDVLVATTVIEVGVNVPNATVMVIEGAERFGLAQLHQLRGRVGRGAQESWCFLMAEPNERLKTLVSTNDGFVVAQKDLELRGAGNLLGPQQSGHLANIGYDLYCKLLEEAVLEAQGEAPKPNRDVETRMDVHVNAYLPAEYVTGDKQRLEVYKRIASITTAAQRDDVEEELVDRFGDEPLCVANLVAVAYLKAMCAKLGIDRVNQADGRIDMRFAANAQVDGQKLFKALTGFDKRLTLNAAPPVTLTLKDTTLNREDLLMLCVKVMERLLARMDLEAA